MILWRGGLDLFFFFNMLCFNGRAGVGYQFMQSAFALALISWVVGVLFVFPGFAAKCMTEKKPSEAKAKEAVDAGDVELEEGKE